MHASVQTPEPAPRPAASVSDALILDLEQPPPTPAANRAQGIPHANLRPTRRRPRYAMKDNNILPLLDSDGHCRVQINAGANNPNVIESIKENRAVCLNVCFRHIVPIFNHDGYGYARRAVKPVKAYLIVILLRWCCHAGPPKLLGFLTAKLILLIRRDQETRLKHTYRNALHLHYPQT